MPPETESTTLSADQHSNEEIGPNAKPRRWWLIGFLAIILLSLLALIILWSQRTIIADRYIQDYLDDLGLDASYEIIDLGTKRQHLRNIRVGNAQNPDILIDDLVVVTTPQLSGIAIDEIRLNGVRLFGEYKDDRLSFGALDQFIYTGSEEPPALPDLNINFDDVRAKIVTPYGAIGISASGAGHLLDGFEGDIGLIANTLAYDGCTLERPRAFLSVAIDALRPKIVGPVRLDNIDCGALGSGTQSGLASDIGAIQTNITISRNLDSAQFSAVGDIAQLFYKFGETDRLTSNRLDISMTGEVNAASIDGEAVLGLVSASTPWADIGNAQIDVALSEPAQFASIDDVAALALRYQLQADNITLNASSRAAIANAGDGLSDTPIGPLFQKMLPVLQRSAASSRLAASGRIDKGFALADTVTIREGNNRLISRIENVRYALSKSGLNGLEGMRFAFSHPQLPKLSGEWNNDGDARTIALTMQEYRAGKASLALGQTQLRFPSGSQDQLDIKGRIRLSGPLPGGEITNAIIPLSGKLVGGSRYFPNNGRCQRISFDRLKLATLSIADQKLSFCSKGAQPLLAYGAEGLSVNARSNAVEVNAKIGDSPLYLASDGVDIAYPAITSMNNVQVRIGEGDVATSLFASSIGLRGGSDFTGDFQGAEAFIGNIPLLLSDGSGTWGFAGSILSIASDDWTLSDRAEAPRFNPLQGRDISLVLEQGIIMAKGDLYAPQKAPKIASVDIVHDLGSAVGGADLNVPGIRFNEALQPSALTDLTIGIIALADGVVEGKGRIDWNSDAVSSSGKFSTDGLDFAAAFGPVKGLKGDIIFSDLLAFETPPDQIVTIDEVNPGIAAYDGVVRYQLLANQRVILQEAHWPFSGGDLSLEPTAFNLAIEEERELNFEMKGLDAAAFLTQFDFENLAATGRFDGRLPMRFNRAGGRIEGGRLTVGPKGGTLSYIGELTYEDLGAYGNFAFESLRDIRYRTLEVEMNGPLDGELVTRVRFDGLSQGESASRNFLTKQIAKLPIQFNINIRAPFFQLITSTRSLYDSAYVLDPVAAGIIKPKNGNNSEQDTQGKNSE